MKNIDENNYDKIVKMIKEKKTYGQIATETGLTYWQIRSAISQEETKKQIPQLPNEKETNKLFPTTEKKILGYSDNVSYSLKIIIYGTTEQIEETTIGELLKDQHGFVSDILRKHETKIDYKRKPPIKTLIKTKLKIQIEVVH